MQLGTIARTIVLDEMVGEYIKAHPDCAIVNIASGMDTRFNRLDNGRIYYDLSGSVLYDGKYLFSFDSDKASGSDNNLITSYSRLGLLVYPGAGETVYFTVDGEAFALSMYDSGEGAKGRYLCRNVTELISEGADKVVSAKKAGKNYGKLLTDPTIFSLMDANGNICYGADDFEWQFLDYGLDYDRLKALMEAGQLPYGVEENIEEEPAAGTRGGGRTRRGRRRCCDRRTYQSGFQER